jgi:hypothetical protein
MWRQASRKVDVGLAITLALITVAPVLVKQHVLADVVIGVPWGLGAYWVAGRLYARLALPDEPAKETLARMFNPFRWSRREVVS